MNPEVADIALTLVLPLGITFVLILQSAASPGRKTKMIGAILSTLAVVMDCLFYFVKNVFVTYDTAGGVFIAFATLFLFGLLYVVRSEEWWPEKTAHLIFSICMLAGCVGIAYWDRLTLIITSPYTPSDVVNYNQKYQDYISSFDDDEEGKVHTTEAKTKTVKVGSILKQAPRNERKEIALGRLENYELATDAVIKRMLEVMSSIDNFALIDPSINEAEREARSQQALAINNNATAINRKALGLFHPHESSIAHTELIQATENLKLAAHTLYTYCLQEDADEQIKLYKLARGQMAQSKVFLERFSNDLQNLKSNNNPQQEE